MNTNCMEGKRCPSCGQSDKVIIYATVVLVLTDEGTDPQDEEDDVWTLVGDNVVRYDDNTETLCPVCRFAGPFGAWDTSNWTELDLGTLREPRSCPNPSYGEDGDIHN